MYNTLASPPPHSLPPPPLPSPPLPPLLHQKAWDRYAEFLKERNEMANKDWLSMRDQVGKGGGGGGMRGEAGCVCMRWDARSGWCGVRILRVEGGGLTALL